MEQIQIVEEEIPVVAAVVVIADMIIMLVILPIAVTMRTITEITIRLVHHVVVLVQLLNHCPKKQQCHQDSKDPDTGPRIKVPMNGELRTIGHDDQISGVNIFH